LSVGVPVGTPTPGVQTVGSADGWESQEESREEQEEVRHRGFLRPSGPAPK